MSEGNLLRQIGRTGRAMHAAFEREVGIALPKWRILQTLHESGRLSQKDLASMLSMDPGALTRQLKQIESELLVKRESSREDNRLTLVELTSKGCELVESLGEKRINFSKKALEGLEEEKMAVALEILKAMEDRFRAAD